MQANSGRVNDKNVHSSAFDISKVVDEIHSTYLSKKKSVLIHCNTGQGRALVFVACYLLKHNPNVKSVTDALGLIYQKRPQVSVSMAELALIEQFRKMHATNKAELNITSKKFEPYRKSWTKTLKLDNPLVQFALFEGATRLFGLYGTAAPVQQTNWYSFDWLFSANKSSSTFESWYTRIFAGAGILFNNGAQRAKEKIGEHAYQHLDKQYATLSDEEKVAVGEGIESAESLGAWANSFKVTDTLWHYSSYLAGVRAKQEKAPLCDKALKEASHIKAMAMTPKPK
jgi:hypothetical protein